MSALSQDIRALVTGTDDVLQVFRNELVSRFESGVLLCFEPLIDFVGSSNQQVESSRGYDCVFFLFPRGAEPNGIEIMQFQKAGLQHGVPTFAVLPSRHKVLERVLLRLGAADVLFLDDKNPWHAQLIETLELHQQVIHAFAKVAAGPLPQLDELKRSELQYRKLVQLSRDIIWSVDAEGRWTFMNEAVHDVLGYTPKEMLGRRFTEFQDPKNAARDLVAFSNVLDGKKYLDYETDYRHKSGHLITLSFNAIVLYGDNGEPTGATGTAMNVSLRRKSAEDLRDQKEFFRRVVDANPNPIAVRNMRGQFVLVNASFAKQLGFAANELIGLTFDEFIKDNAFLQETKACDAALLADPSKAIVTERCFPNSTTGNDSWYQNTKKILYIPHSDKTYFLDISVDLSERRRSEDALKHVIEGTASATAEDYFQLLTEHLAAALEVPSTFILALSDSDDALQLLASSPRNAIPHNIKLSIDSPLFEQLVKNSMLHITSDDTNNLLPPELGLGDSAVLTTLLHDSKGDPIGLLAVVDAAPFEERDLPEYLLKLFGERASAELARIRSEKETKSLERQLLQAQKMEAIGTLAAGVAHDLNNALGAVTGHLQLIEGNKNISTEQQHSLHVALDGCSRASSLVHQLLGFSRQGRYLPEQINVQEALSEMIDFLNCATRKNIKITTRQIGEDLFVHADKNQLQQVLMNLIINAQQAMPDGGSIAIEAKTDFVTLPEQYNSNASQGEYTIINVTDTGKGIEPMICDKIFEPFFTTKPSQVGTGLGLSMVYGIMQNHGGWVDVSSIMGEGSTFSLFFPRTVKAKDFTRQIGARPSSNEPLVLVIDDEPFLVDLTCRFLERSHFRSRGFTSPKTAIRWFQEHADEVDLTILDMKMPQQDGRSCFREIRTIDPEAAVVILSGYIQDEAAQEVMDEGALRYFQKPLRYSELIDWVRNHLLERDPDNLTANSQ